MRDSDRHEVLSVLRAQEDAVRRGDAQAVIAPIAREAVMYDLPPPLEFRAGDRDGTSELEAWFETWEGPVKVEMSEPTVLIDGSLAVVYALSRMQGLKKGQGQVDSWNRRTIVLQRFDGHWQIIHEHSSYPMMMDGSGRAATDLRP